MIAEMGSLEESDYRARRYVEGDSLPINRLYQLLTGRNRTDQQYEWEWQKTSQGVGWIRLLFGAKHLGIDGLVAHYGLIPIPFSAFGDSCMCGKTENCMAHPDIRSTGTFFKHEQQSFALARQEFDIFYTTASATTGGRVARIREALGYMAIGSWTRYTFCTNVGAATGDSVSALVKCVNAKPQKRHLRRLVQSIETLGWGFVQSMRYRSRTGADIRISVERSAPLEEIEALWMRNKSLFGITVNRTAQYLRWRICENPYHQHTFLCLYKDGKLAGYAIVHEAADKTLSIDDLLVDANNPLYLAELTGGIVRFARKRRALIVAFSTLEGNETLRRRFKKLGFLVPKLRHAKVKDFYAYVSKEIQNKFKRESVFDENSWYTTDLMKEGC